MSTVSSTDSEPNTNTVREWASRVVAFSSEYNQSSQSAVKVLGTPQVYPNYGDLSNTWAQAAGDFHSAHFIELEFPLEIYVSQVNIYETYHCGAVVGVQLKDAATNKWQVVWQSETGRALNIEHSRIFSPPFEPTLFKTKHVRLDLDCTACNSYAEIDAVELVGKKFLIDPVPVEQTLARDLGQLLASETFADVEFLVEGQVVRAHRNILAARNVHFKSMLCDNLSSTRPILIDNMTARCFRALVAYLYTGEVSGVVDKRQLTLACELMRASEWYELDELRQAALECIRAQLDVANVIDVLVCATSAEPVLTECEDMCVTYVSRHFEEIATRDQFKRLEQPLLVKLTQNFANQ